METRNKDVWVFVEQRSGRPAAVSLELLCKGRKLAATLGGKLRALVIGNQMSAVIGETFRHGANDVLLVEHADLANYKTMPYSRIVSELVEQHQPAVVLFGATFVGRDLAPRVASRTRSGLTADCTDLQIGDVSYLRKDYQQLLLQIRPAFGGNIIATIISPDVPVQMATVREGVMELAPLSTPQTGALIEVAYIPQPSDGAIQIVERHQEQGQTSLQGAPIIVAGGYGVGSNETFALLHELAGLIGGEVAGTRAAVDAGFIGHDRQVGQTGLTVRPKLYIACGISGAVQHVAGMQESSRIIAINSDPQAPIFDVCHYGIVGEVAEVLPTLIETYKERLR